VSTPLIALTVGDPAGIGPELARAVLAQPGANRRLVVVGPQVCRPEGVPEFDPALAASWFVTEGPGDFDLGRAQASCGRAALAALRAGVDLVHGGPADALVTGPVCKQALHMAGEPVEGQTELLARWAGAQRFEMIGLAGDLRVMLLSRHLPLREAVAAVATEPILDRLRLFDGALRQRGFERPRLAVAGLNPHAGEGGVLGHEEGDLLAPAVAAARAEGLDVSGPRSPDTVFLEGSQGRWDGVLALYHDQAFVPLKLLSAGRGLTWIAGLPYLRLSPVHGTAFDLAGTGRADATNLRHAVETAACWAR
jgi:4-hydroxythreonine-4-phosphate dehydrogenase